MKPSMFNHFIEWENKLHLVFNAKTCALLKVNRRTFSLLQGMNNNLTNNPTRKLSAEVLKQLEDGGILIPKDIDEILQLQIDTTKKRYANNSLSMTIAPTLECNFSCKYCYEKHKTIHMDDDIRLKLLSFLEWYLRDIKYLDIVWYGGEPLLAKDILFEMTEEIVRLCQKHNVKSNFSMITNGYFLTKDVISRMHALGINGVQVTIDGPPDIHDARRPLSGGSGTFVTIMNNLKNCEGLIPNIVIRVNVDRNNLEHLRILKQILNEQGILRFAKLSFSNVDAISESNRKYEPHCLNMQEFSELNIEHLLEEFKEGNYDMPVPPAGSGCGAIASNSWVIAPDGFLYKCWCEIGYEEKSVGHLSEPFRLNRNYYEWLSFDVLGFTECKNCDILPLCMGACPDKLKKLGPGSFCTRWKYFLKEMLILYYLAKQKSKVERG